MNKYYCDNCFFNVKFSDELEGLGITGCFIIQPKLSDCQGVSHALINMQILQNGGKEIPKYMLFSHGAKVEIIKKREKERGGYKNSCWRQIEKEKGAIDENKNKG